MKQRIKIDSALLSLIIIFTGVLFQFRSLYASHSWVDNFLDVPGFILIFKGAVIRFLARGHKMAHSQQGKDLVASGLYHVVRNPMYLGSFYLGVGFALLLWPWWSLPVFAWLFYLRFDREMRQEEARLSKQFGADYQSYCQKVPRLIPNLESLKKVKSIDFLKSWQEGLRTKEKWGLMIWPIVAFLLEDVQQRIIFHDWQVKETLQLFILAAIIFSVGFQLKTKVFLTPSR